MRIDRCICLDRLIADLLAQARREGLSVEEVMRLPGRGVQGERRCGLCRPYLCEAWRTGQTVFTQVIESGGRQEGGN